jgi:uncharacterized protein (TIGR03437 family)
MVDPVEPTGTGGSQQVLIAELDPTGSHLLFSTIIGSHGLNTTNPAGLAVNGAGDIYVAGNTTGPDLITTPGAFQTTSHDGACCQKGNGFVVKIASDGPHISSVVDAAGLQPAISPGAWVSIFGTDLAETSRLWRANEVVAGKLPTQLDGVSVTIDGKPSAVFYISPTQLDVQGPDGAAAGAVEVAVTTPQGRVTTTTTMQTVSPGLFAYAAANKKYVAAVHGDFSLVGPSNPARQGEIVTMYGTGFGPTAPATPSGQVVTTAKPIADLAGISVTIGGKQAQVQSAGIPMAGVWQLNVQVPADAPAGDAAIVAQVGGKSTQSGVFMAIHTAAPL